jgi:FkbM family methyltransferase
MRKNLIYDIGMNDGRDTAHYLTRGFDVVGVEANLSLVAMLREKFATPIAEGRLTIVPKAVAAKRGTVQLAVAEKSIWSSISPTIIDRNVANHVRLTCIDVEAVEFGDILKEHGMPYYLKADIEGVEILCIEALLKFEDRPKYVSFETIATTAQADYASGFNELALLWTLGYRAFKYVDQSKLKRLNGQILDKEGPPFIYRNACSTGDGFSHDSGPFGEETPGPWLSAKEALSSMNHLVLKQNLFGWGGKYSRSLPSRMLQRLQNIGHRRFGWYDLHACLGGEPRAALGAPADPIKAVAEGIQARAAGATIQSFVR